MRNEVYLPTYYQSPAKGVTGTAQSTNNLNREASSQNLSEETETSSTSSVGRSQNEAKVVSKSSESVYFDCQGF